MEKRILFVMILLLGTIVTFAQEKKLGVVNVHLHEQAVKALENCNFIITYNTFETNRGRKLLDSRYCFFEVKGDCVSYQEYNGRADELSNFSVNHFPKLSEGKVSDYNIERQKNGDVCVSMLLKTKYSSRTFYIRIKLENNTNKCKLSFSKRQNKDFGSYYTGSLYPIGAIAVLKGEPRRYY